MTVAIKEEAIYRSTIDVIERIHFFSTNVFPRARLWRIKPNPHCKTVQEKSVERHSVLSVPSEQDATALKMIEDLSRQDCLGKNAHHQTW